MFMWRQHLTKSSFLFSISISLLQATMLKKIKTKRRLTEPIIQPAVVSLAAAATAENGEKDPLGT